MGLKAMLAGGFISEHDYKIALKVAFVMTGGNANSSVKVSEDYLLDIEREAFCRSAVSLKLWNVSHTCSSTTNHCATKGVYI